MATFCQQSAIQEDFAEERAEVEAVIASSLRPNSNMAQLLRYVCEKRFTGHSDEIKEYSIAVEALRRPPSFDPSKDSIVRVEAHRLRSRLDSFYQRDGAGHSVRIMIPAGTYVPVFQLQSSALAIDTGAEPLPAETPLRARARFLLHPRACGRAFPRPPE